jgi:Flp pilus assembly protein TadG
MTRDDEGTAIIEFVFVAVIVMLPLVYLIVAVAGVQRSELAVSQAAREVGRAFATSDHASDAMARADVALQIALRDQGLPDDAELRYIASGETCADEPPTITPQLSAGAEFTVCVRRRVDLPGVPNVLLGKGITTWGEYVVHVDDYRTVR